ncbi:MAG TPA: hypothetical protein VIJ28_19260 [Chloroflexota bacterium]|jgi:hypothetical protein
MLTTPYTDTYLYRQDGAPYELIRQSAGTGPCGAATCKYWYLVDGRDNVVALTNASGRWWTSMPTTSGAPLPTQRLAVPISHLVPLTG